MRIDQAARMAIVCSAGLGVLDPSRITAISETRADPLHHPRPRRRLTEQQSAGVARDHARVELRLYPTATETLE